ncbi:MAG: LysM peptidoglycan-binding domain-containing protein [Rhodothermaceae bacterium]
MKLTKSLLTILALLFFSVATFAQERDMSFDEWEAEINRLNAKKADLTTEIAGLKKDISGLKSKLAGLQDPTDCTNELYALVGATKSDVDAFGRKLDALMAKIMRKEAYKEDRVAEWEELKASKIGALPQFFDKLYNQAQRALDAWKAKPREVMYTVVKGDCLWYIAKRKEHYGNGFAWPKIYNANRDQIKNPDLIYPKQIFKVPNLTDEEAAHYEKLRKNYKPAPVNN